MPASDRKRRAFAIITAALATYQDDELEDAPDNSVRFRPDHVCVEMASEDNPIENCLEVASIACSMLLSVAHATGRPAADIWAEVAFKTLESE